MKRPSAAQAITLGAAIAAILVVAVVLAGTGWAPAGSAAEPPPERPPEQVERDSPIDDPKPKRRLTEAEAAPEVTEDDCSLEVLDRDEDRTSRPADEIDKVTFSVQFADEVSPYRVMSALVLPGEQLEVEAVLTDRLSTFDAALDRGQLEALEPGRWRVTAPAEPGQACLRITDETSQETMALNLLVTRPYNGEEVFHGYKVGSYPSRALRGLAAYERPAGLFAVTEENQDLWISPHFQLKQFLCKQESGWPKFVLIAPRLLLKLEMLLEEVNERGIPADSFYVMSGYRTPFYNRAIGNRTSYSRHTYGDAADIFVDMDRNGWMDDLDESGEVTRADARLLWNVVEDLYGESWYMPFVGGLGLYGPKPHRGPFVHVDTRGYRARW
jgi:hypothetical protein